MLSRTHNTDYNIMWYISCWLGPTTSSVFHVDSDSQHWLSYHVMYSMLTGTHNIIIAVCWLGLTTLIIISCNIFHADWDQLHYCMLTRTHSTDYDIMNRNIGHIFIIYDLCCLGLKVYSKFMLPRTLKLRSVSWIISYVNILC